MDCVAEGLPRAPSGGRLGLALCWPLGPGGQRRGCFLESRLVLYMKEFGPKLK